MKKLLSIVLMTIVLLSCDKEEVALISAISNADLETSVIYEANIRQYSPEGTFEEFTKDIPELKKLGVKIVWVMPIFPISKTNRKATGGAESKFASEFPVEEQSKYLGSYYAVSDFTKINPEFGTIDDFRKLVTTAHQHGMYVVLDWVPNHTGWDHTWLTTHRDFYTQNENGEVIHPKDTDWTDTADLNYDNPKMRKQMILEMKYWLQKENIDGFRCDVAGSVPISFWKTAIPELRQEKDIFMLAEAWEPELLEENLFDMAYGWDGHHLMNSMAKGEKTVEDLKTYINNTYLERYAEDDILMNFVTNHDENSWSGTIQERMGTQSELMTVLSYILPGMPLIYSGQEYDLNYRLKFFEKDSIPKAKGKTFALLQKLGKLKNTHSALNGGKEKATFEVLKSTDEVFILKRSKGDQTLLFIANFSKNPSEVVLSGKGSFTDFMSGESLEIKGKQFQMDASTYKILIN